VVGFCPFLDINWLFSLHLHTPKQNQSREQTVTNHIAPLNGIRVCGTTFGRFCTNAISSACPTGEIP